jgi:LPS-assembly lipoprotein
MSEKRKRAAAFFFLTSVLCLLTSACGFHPIYGAREDNAPVAAELNEVAIGNIADRNGQMLRNDLIDRMYGKGRPQNPKYNLEVKLRATEEGIGLLPNAITTLNELNVYGEYTLTDQSGKALVSATAHAVANFDQLQEQYGTLAARDNAYRRCLDEVSAQIVERLSMYFSEGPLNKTPPKKPDAEPAKAAP